MGCFLYSQLGLLPPRKNTKCLSRSHPCIFAIERDSSHNKHYSEETVGGTLTIQTDLQGDFWGDVWGDFWGDLEGRLSETLGALRLWGLYGENFVG